MQNTFQNHVSEYQMRINEICALIKIATANPRNCNSTIGAINKKLEQIDRITTKILDMIEPGARYNEQNPDYMRYLSAHKQFLDALDLFETILCDPRPNQR